MNQLPEQLHQTFRDLFGPVPVQKAPEQTKDEREVVDTRTVDMFLGKPWGAR